MECTVSTEQGRTWREYQDGTRSRIVLPCPHCSAWVAPEREHLIGWQDAAEPGRGPGARRVPLSRVQASLERRRIAHRPTRRRGCCTGSRRSTRTATSRAQPPATDTLGFRWSAVHNLFITAGDLAADEWRARRSHGRGERRARDAAVRLVHPRAADQVGRDGARRHGTDPPRAAASLRASCRRTRGS